MTHASRYRIEEVNGGEFSIPLRSWNTLDESFPPLTDAHLCQGYWWFTYGRAGAVAFAGMVPFVPFPRVGYFKRAYVEPAHRGHGLQRALMDVREARARALDWTMLVSECARSNVASAHNFAAAGFEQFEPEQRWGAPDSIYWQKDLRCD